MDKFIEITDVAGDKMLINAEHISSVEIWRRGHDMPLVTQINLVGGTHPKTYESYEDIKKKIENVGKTFITDGIYVRRSE